MVPQLAFMYVAPGAKDYKDLKVTVANDFASMYVIGVGNYDQAEKAAKELVAEGVKIIELCGGFGAIGLARVKKAVGPDIPVGAVRFDYHPAMGFKTGDDLFPEQ